MMQKISFIDHCDRGCANRICQNRLYHRIPDIHRFSLHFKHDQRTMNLTMETHFYFSLPITRKLYALEKYVFGFLTGACSCLISLILCMIFGLIFGNYSISDSLMTAGMSFPMFLFLLLLMLPVHLKFGSEKGKLPFSVYSEPFSSLDFYLSSWISCSDLVSSLL